jgi:hypothetical protein
VSKNRVQEAMEMKCVVRGQSKEKRLPEVGEAWKHEDLETVFLRIDDDKGREALGHSEERSEYAFYSTDLDTGDIVWTNKDTYDISILVPKDGVIEFEEVR